MGWADSRGGEHVSGSPESAATLALIGIDSPAMPAVPPRAALSDSVRNGGSLSGVRAAVRARARLLHGGAIFQLRPGPRHLRASLSSSLVDSAKRQFDADRSGVLDPLSAAYTHRLPLRSRVVVVLGPLEQPERNVDAGGLGQLEVARSPALKSGFEQEGTERTEKTIR